MNKNNKAFTLIELIVVMAIIAILVLLAAPSFLNYTKDAKVSNMKQDAQVLSRAASTYHIANKDWPVKEVTTPLNIGVGGVEGLMPIDEAKVSNSIKNISGDYSDYALSTKGDYEGQVFHLDGLEDREGYTNYGNNKSSRQPVRFDGVDYKDISEVPESPESWFRTSPIEGGCQIDGFSDEVKAEGAPTKIRIPDQIDGKDVIAIAGSERHQSDFKNIEELVLSQELKKIGNNAFFRNKIRRLVIPNNVKTIGAYAFVLGEINELDLGNGVKSLSTGVFENNKLTTLIIPESLKSIGSVAFYSNQLENIIIPDSYISLGVAVFNDNLLSDEDAFIYKRNKNGTLNKEEIISYGGKTRKEITIPKGVKKISFSSFIHNNLVKVHLPDSIETISKEAFVHNKIDKIDIPVNTKVNPDAFDINVTIKRN